MPEAVVVLDAGAFIAYERSDSRVRALLELAQRRGTPVLTSAAVVAQVWRGSPRQARLARLFGSGLVDERPFDSEASRIVGARCSTSGSTDVVDGHVAVLADPPHARVVTGDGDDLVRLGVPEERVVRI